ncbi:EamA family transporter RarD [Chitinasiproducens palmae]|uniref:Chloramphenicol-sensitive protein RarD n=1 Tax=Chitinasiproducens palmae TaxID=1770053 RepID=A0A1H2PW13_9BURK|nr:EamA family transporter RarD [Chitinasiproducens palmae]SDV51513.1 chloramphenicol-sensitive protein RarD [Chitinasiproducens palmae]
MAESVSNRSSKGVLLSVMASVLFSVLYYFVTLLGPLDATEIFGWRMLLTAPCVALFVVLSGAWPQVRDIAERARTHGALWLAMPVCALLLAVQLLLFMWAPLHNRALEVSLGYFLLPLLMVVIGRLHYGERLTPLKRVATLCAAFGVCHELYRVGSVSWETLVVALGYPLYFILRRRFRLDSLGGFCFDVWLMVPIAVYLVLHGPSTLATYRAHPALFGLVPVLGLISAAALVSYMVSSRLLPFGLFGLLGYVEPVMLLGVALLLGGRISGDAWLTYAPIWLGVAMLVAEGAMHVLASRASHAAR